ncbi:hypothetical protein CBR_g3794 [Chara braunii]|uniref:Reverse transcriptase RNase H-like domain-containing protein n=1 Tax=Chara braunii TaxID=69332 RepID=A0A388KGE7_CHABU|nr:hypothetical protein CBR_g3794 [Chara braunii]|eukprot:GBG69096.1 hypothetical protein CBR_g3794 [Chara braunii]
MFLQQTGTVADRTWTLTRKTVRRPTGLVDLRAAASGRLRTPHPCYVCSRLTTATATPQRIEEPAATWQQFTNDKTPPLYSASPLRSPSPPVAAAAARPASTRLAAAAARPPSTRLAAATGRGEEGVMTLDREAMEGENGNQSPATNLMEQRIFPPEEMLLMVKRQKPRNWHCLWKAWDVQTRQQLYHPQTPPPPPPAAAAAVNDAAEPIAVELNLVRGDHRLGLVFVYVDGIWNRVSFARETHRDTRAEFVEPSLPTVEEEENGEHGPWTCLDNESVSIAEVHELPINRRGKAKEEVCLEPGFVLTHRTSGSRREAISASSADEPRGEERDYPEHACAEKGHGGAITGGKDRFDVDEQGGETGGGGGGGDTTWKVVQLPDNVAVYAPATYCMNGGKPLDILVEWMFPNVPSPSSSSAPQSPSSSPSPSPSTAIAGHGAEVDTVLLNIGANGKYQRIRWASYLEAISAILAQVGPSGLESVVEYASKSVPACKRKYTAPTGECYAALWGISHFRAYLYRQKFTLVIDHEPLLALKESKDYSGIIGRWATVLQSMDFDIRHRKHERHGNADGLTRLHRPEKLLKSKEMIPWNAPEQKIGPRYGQVEVLSKQTSHVTTAAGFTGDISSVNPQRHTAILASLREWTEQVSNVWQHVLAREGYNIIPISASDLDGIRRAPRERPIVIPTLWTSCLEEPRDEESTLPSRQEYMKPYEIIPYAFYPRAEEVVIHDDDNEEEDNNEETSEEGSHSEHSEGELSEEEEKEEGTRSEREALPEEATCTGTEAEDPEVARKREEIASGKRQLESSSEASLRIGSDLTREPLPPMPKDGGPAAATSSTTRRRRRQSPSSSSPTRPPVRPRTDAGDRPSFSDAVPLAP